MPDTRTRELERSAAGGDDEARARLLQERVRGGTLDPEHLRLAAYLGEPAALLICGGQGDTSDLLTWGQALENWGAEVCIRALTATTELTLTLWEAWEPGELEPGSRLRTARDTVRASFGDPDLLHEARLLLVAGHDAIDGASRHLASLEAEHGLSLTKAWKAHAAGLATLFATRSMLGYVEGTARASLNGDLGDALNEARTVLESAEPVLTAVRATLTLWALS